MRVVKISDVDNLIISIMEQSSQGEQDPFWDPFYKALEILRAMSFEVEENE